MSQIRGSRNSRFWMIGNAIVVAGAAAITIVYNGCGQFKVAESDFSSKDLPPRWETSGVFAPAQSSGIRLLSAREYDSSVKALLEESQPIGSQLLPEDNFEPFDNFAENMGVSAAKVQAYESAAAQIVDRFLADSPRMQRVLPCIPGSTSDRECFQKIVIDLGRKAFRRPVETEDVTLYTDTIAQFAASGGSYLSGIEVFLKALLQHPQFLYRWEVGLATNGSETLFILDDFELASRLAFTLWGQPPTSEILDAAAQGQLRNIESYSQIVDQMLNDPRALAQVDFFHSAWLGYYAYKDQSNLSKMMRAETQALLNRIIFEEDRPWSEVLTSDQTYVTRELASHYGLPQPAADAGWVTYNSTQRRGLLSHGSFLSVGGKFGDTSPIQRGYNIRKNVFCEQIPPPPPNVNVDEPPMGDTSSPCKQDHHLVTTLRPGTSCLGCHQKMDRIGFGLENFDAGGVFRETQPGLPECRITGEGEAAGYGRFNGPAELAQLALDSGRIERCLVERWVQLSFGRKNDEFQETLVGKYSERFQQTKSFKDLVRQFVISDDFRHRRPLEE